MSRLSRLAPLFVCLALRGVAVHGQAVEQAGNYAGLGLGWVVPLGEVTSITNLVQFSSPVPASDLYNPGLAIHLMLGRRVRGWLLEGSIDARIAPLTDSGQVIVNQTRTDGRKVDVEYATFGIFGGRVLHSAGEPRQRLTVFAGVGVDLVVVLLTAGSGVQPYDDTGVGASAKVGIDWLPSKAGRVALRLAGRYQLGSAGVDIPNDAIFQVLTVIRF